jgi:hypothetical protein
MKKLLFPVNLLIFAFWKSQEPNSGMNDKLSFFETIFEKIYSNQKVEKW